MVHSPGDLLAAGAAGGDCLSVCVATSVAVPHSRNCSWWSAGTGERDHISSGAHGEGDLTASLGLGPILSRALSSQRSLDYLCTGEGKE